MLVVFGTIIVAVLSLVGLVLKNVLDRLRQVETDLRSERAQNRRVWFWARSILDLYFKWRKDGAPDPPPPPPSLDVK